MNPEKLEPGNATDSEYSDTHSVTSEQSSCSSCSSSRTPSSRKEFESIDLRKPNQKQQSLISVDAEATSSPNYMKTTTSSVAKKSNNDSQRSGGRSLTRRGSFIKPAKGLARMSSSKFRMRKSFRRRADLSRRVHSVSDDLDWCSSDSEGTRTGGTKSVRTLVKVASLRIRRQSKSSMVKATCSSALKDSKAEGSHSNESSSAAAGMKVCPYSYCSLHGHHHSNNDQAPSLKRFVSMRRRMLKPQKKGNNSSEKGSQQSSYINRPKGSNKERQGDQTKKGDVISESYELGQAANGGRQDSCLKVKGGPLENDISNICEGHNQPEIGSREIKDLVTSPSAKGQNADMEDHPFADHKPDGGHLSSENSMEKNNYMGLWGLIYQHMVSGTAVTDGDESQQPEKLGEQPVEESSGVDQRADGEVDSHQHDAVKLVQEAFDNILLDIPDPLSDNQLVGSVDTASDELGDNKNNNTSASMEQVQQEQMKMEDEISNGSQGDKAEAKVGNKSGQKRLNGWSNLKKIMLMRRFVKAMEKVKSYNNTHKPRGQSIEQDGEAAEMVNLRPQSIGQKKNSEEWMLDYAIQKVISTMAPAQKRKVALIVQAFETVAPQGETGSNAASSTPKTPVQISRDISTQKVHEQEEVNPRFGILLRKVSTGSKENHDQDSSDACTVKHHIHAPCPQPAVDELASETGTADLNPAVHDDTGDLIRLEPESGEHIGPIGEEPHEPGYKIANIHQEEPILDDSFDNDTSEEITNGNEDTQPATEAESPVGKQQHMKLWYLIYNHMVSGTTQPLQENGEEDTHSGRNESRSQLEAIRLVEEAIDEIPLPEAQDEAQKLINPHVEEASAGSNKERLEAELTSSKTEVKPSSEEDGKEKDQAKPPLRKSWSNLKKVILLKRFIKSLEKVNDTCLTSPARKIISPREPQFLGMEHEKEAEKVQLRHQDIGDRKNGDEWMLDYALRQVVAQLTPVRRRKVLLLVEAFETVTPIGS